MRGPVILRGTGIPGSGGDSVVWAEAAATRLHCLAGRMPGPLTVSWSHQHRDAGSTQRGKPLDTYALSLAKGSGGLGSVGHEALLDGRPDERPPRWRVEPCSQMVEVVLDSLDADLEGCCDVFVRPALPDQCPHLALPLGEHCTSLHLDDGCIVTVYWHKERIGNHGPLCSRNGPRHLEPDAPRF